MVRSSSKFVWSFVLCSIWPIGGLAAGESATGEAVSPTVDHAAETQDPEPSAESSGASVGAGEPGSASAATQAADTTSETQTPKAADVMTAAEAASSGAAVLEEVVVTATKRAEPLHKVGSAVSVMTGDKLARLHAGKFEDFAAYMPGVSFQSEGMGKNQITVRGVTTGIEQGATVGVYVDEIPIGSSSSYAYGSNALDFDTFDLEQVEVLRGPQGTIYGANAMGGLLKYQTVAPSIDYGAGLIQAEGSRTHHGGDNYSLRGALGGAFPNAGVGLRITGYHVDDAGFIDDPNRGLQRTNSGAKDGLRGSLRWVPTPELDVRFTAIHQSIDRAGPDAVDRDIQTGEPIQGKYEQSFVLDQPFTQDLDLYSAVLNWDIGWASLTSATGWQEQFSFFAFDQTRQFGGALGTGDTIAFLGTVPINSRKFTQELRLTSTSSDPFGWQIGLFYVDEDADEGVTFDAKGINLPVPLAQLPLLAELFPALVGTVLGTVSDIVPLAGGNIFSAYREIAAYGNVNYYLTDDFDVTVGFRYSLDDQDFDQALRGVLYNPTDPFTTVHTTGGSRETVRNYLVNPRYRLSRNTLLYARVANGYRPGGPNFISSAGGSPATFEPDTVWNYEAGLKWSFANRRGFVDLSAYYLDWDKIQLFVTTPELFNIFVNGGKAQLHGAELVASYSPRRWPAFGMSLGYNEGYLAEDAPGAGGHEGDRLPNSPHFTGAATLDYGFPLMGNIQGAAGMSYRYIADRRAGFDGSAQSPQYFLPSYSLFDLRLDLKIRGFSAGFYLKNVLNEEAQLSANVTERQFDSTAPARVSITLPRTFGLVLGLNFGAF